MTRKKRVRDLTPATAQPQEMARRATHLPASPMAISELATPTEEFANGEPERHPGVRDVCHAERPGAGVAEAVAGDLVESPDDPTALERARLARAKRDATGFITDAVPHVTALQLTWLTHRLETEDDQAACSLSGTDPYDVLRWMADPGFRATYEQALENKREGFKTLTSHLLPSVIRSMQSILESGNNKDKLTASTVLLRAQGLMVDKTQQVDPSAIQGLFALLREERPVEARILDVTAHRVIKDSDDGDS